MDNRLPDVIQPLLATYLRLMEEKLPGLMTGCYLHGSIALGAFDPRFSDIDFIALLSRPCTEDDLTRLCEIHTTIASKYPRWKLEGSYLQESDLGKLESEIQPSPYHHDGIFNPAGKFDVSLVTWWILQKQGITLTGPTPDALKFTVDQERMIADMHVNLNSYWMRWTSPRILLTLLFDEGIQWAVTGVLRQFYTFQTGEITSKVDAGKYALSHLPARWHQIIQEAIRIREQRPGSYYRFKVLRAVEGWRFMRYIVFHPVMQGKVVPIETDKVR